jgi:hypothetical protein
MVIVDDDNEVYVSEFGIVDTLNNSSIQHLGIGTIGVSRDTNVKVTFTPNPNIDVHIKFYVNALRYQDDFNQGTD